MRALVIALVALALTAAPVLAAPAVASVATPGVDADGALPVAFVLTGEAPGRVLPVTAAVHTATFVYACVTPGGHVGATQTVAGLAWSSAHVLADAGGTVRGTVMVRPLPTTLGCPGHRQPVLRRATYQNIAVSAPDPIVSSGLNGTWSRSF